MPPSCVHTGSRGCGSSRKAGGVYLVTPLSPHGRPIGDFLWCPPKLLNFDISPQGQTPVEVGGVYHLLDWIGKEHYPNVADWVEETAAMGLSRVINWRSLELERITPDSRLITVHPKAYIHNLNEFGPAFWVCPRGVGEHIINVGLPAEEMCTGALWWDVEGGEVLEPTPHDEEAAQYGYKLVQRQMPSFSYYAHARPDGVEPVYSPAMFGAFPIARIEVVKGDYGEHEAAAETLAALRLSVDWRVVDD